MKFSTALSCMLLEFLILFLKHQQSAVPVLTWSLMYSVASLMGGASHG